MSTALSQSLIVNQSGTSFCPTESGIRIGNNSTLSGPKIIAQASTDCMSDAIARESERFNQGIQGHCYSELGDMLIVRTPMGEENNATLKELFTSAFDLNATLWRKQTGIELASSSNGRLVFAPAGKTLRQCFIEAAKEYSASRAAFALMLKPEVLTELGVNDPTLLRAANSVGLLEKKTTAMQIFAQLGICVPESINLSTSTMATEAAIPRLDPNKRYIIKQDGLCGGFGNFTNGSKGYAAEEIPKTVLALVQDKKLQGEFQLQEFITGQSVGALALFDGSEQPRLLSIHKEVQVNSGFQGSIWTPTLERELAPQIAEVFQKLADCSQLGLLGPIGIDAIYSNGQIYVIECNPRLTGASPITKVLANRDQLRDKSGKPVAVKSIEIDINVDIPANIIATNGLQQLVERSIGQYAAEQRGKIIKQLEVTWEEAGRRGRFDPDLIDAQLQARLAELELYKPMILPQGISPVEKSKVLFVNDPEGRLKELFKQNLAGE